MSRPLKQALVKKALAWAIALAACAALAVAWAAGADKVLMALRGWALAYKGVVAHDPLPFWLGFLAFGAVAVNSPLPLAGLFKVLAGYLFGLAGGFALNVAMSVLGGLIGFAAVRHFLFVPLHARFAGRLARADLEIARNGFWYVLSARLLMAAPFFLVNVAAGLSCLRLRKFLAGTFLGVFPSSFIYAESGRQLASISSMSDLASPSAAAVLALLAALSVVPALARRRKGGNP